MQIEPTSLSFQQDKTQSIVTITNPTPNKIIFKVFTSFLRSKSPTPNFLPSHQEEATYLHNKPHRSKSYSNNPPNLQLNFSSSMLSSQIKTNYPGLKLTDSALKMSISPWQDSKKRKKKKHKKDFSQEKSNPLLPNLSL